jgi:branched-chain amino acid transport system substrate-binding protein
MPYRYFYDQDEAPYYQQLAAFKRNNVPNFSGYVTAWELEGRLNLELWKLCMERVIEADQEVTPDNLMAALGNIRGWDSGGFFGRPVDVVSNKIGQGRVYRYNAGNKLYEPVSDWITV